MSTKIKGQRPRPRVALLGRFGNKDRAQFGRMFPTQWYGVTIDDLKEKVDVREIDLLIIDRGVNSASDWPEKVHVICFSEKLGRLPGPTPNTLITHGGRAETETYVYPELSLPFDRCRNADFINLSSVRGWLRLHIAVRPDRGCPILEMNEATKTFEEGAIICEFHTDKPLATQYLRKENKLGVAWLPYTPIDKAAWVDVLVTEWAKSDKEHFPNFGDWTASPEWMVKEELDIDSSIKALEQKRQKVIAQIDAQIGDLTSKLSAVKADINRGRRRLITAQGPELVDEVKKAFQDIGFEVSDIDELLGEGVPKREDLRLRDPSSGQKDWEAIVEVAGYARSGGKTADLLSLGRFANLYQQETGRLPDKQIYVVNCQIELLPSQRKEPLAASKEDLQVFTESNGIVIWTLDLFRAVKATNSKGYSALRKSIKEAVGIWQAVR